MCVEVVNVSYRLVSLVRFIDVTLFKLWFFPYYILLCILRILKVDIFDIKG